MLRRSASAPSALNAAASATSARARCVAGTRVGGKDHAALAAAAEAGAGAQTTATLVGRPRGAETSAALCASGTSRGDPARATTMTVGPLLAHTSRQRGAAARTRVTLPETPIAPAIASETRLRHAQPALRPGTHPSLNDISFLTPCLPFCSTSRCRAPRPSCLASSAPF
jgi:hypothetical protein